MNTSDESFELIHQIFVLDSYLVKPLDTAGARRITRQFIDEFMEALGLEPLGPLGIYPAVDERAPGWSFIQPITTSHISAHYFEKPGKAPHIRVDAYSCDRINWRALVQICDRHFCLADWQGTFIERHIDSTHNRAVTAIAGCGSTIEMNHPLRQSTRKRHTTAAA